MQEAEARRMKRMQEAEARRMKKRLHQDINRNFDEQMHKSYQKCDATDTTYAKAAQEAECLIKGRYPRKKQSSYLDIPVFPSRYYMRSLSYFGHGSQDYLPSDATRVDFAYLYLQLSHHSMSLASLVLPTSVPDYGAPRRLEHVAATPCSPPLVARPVGGLQHMEVDESTSKPGVKSNRDKALAKAGGPNAKTPSKPPKKIKKEVELRPDQDTYHTIRVYSLPASKFLEVLRQDSDGYIIGWRLLTSLAQRATAYWCLFKDFAYLQGDLSFLNIRIINYTSGYGNLKHIYYGRGTLDIIIKDFLTHLYEHPDQTEETTGNTYFYILMMLFGEGPRLEEVRRFFYSSMEHDHYVSQTRHTFGPVRNNLVLKWSYTCDTLFYLCLIQFEKMIMSELFREDGMMEGPRRDAITPFIEQHNRNVKEAQHRCEFLMERFRSVFHLLKDEEDAQFQEHLEEDQEQDHLEDVDQDHQVGKCRLYGVVALHQLLSQELHLLKHNEGLVSSIILRRGRFNKIDHPALIDEEKKAVATANDMFWKEVFDKFVNMESHTKMSPSNVMDFLFNARAFLLEFRFPVVQRQIYDDIVTKCACYEKLLLKGTLMGSVYKPWSVHDVAQYAWNCGRAWENSGIPTISLIVNFLQNFRPNN